MNKIIQKVLIIFITISIISCVFNISGEAEEKEAKIFQPGVLYNVNEFSFNEDFYGMQINVSDFDGDYKDPYYEGGTIKWSIHEENIWLAQSFKAAHNRLSKVKVYLSRSHTASMVPYYLEIRESLYEPWLIGIGLLNLVPENGGWVQFTIANPPCVLTPGHSYCIILHLSADLIPGQYLEWWYGFLFPYNYGVGMYSEDSGQTWQMLPIYDFNFQIWGYDNTPPYTPSNPNPADGATGVNINADLSWTGGDPNPGDTVTYDVYFGSTNPPPKLVSNQTGTTFDPGTMSSTTHYYWKIVSWDNHAEKTPGPVWDFTTTDVNHPPYTPSNPSPANHATGVSTTVDLSWTGGDPDPGDTVVYDVYLEAGDPTPDILVSDDQSTTSYDPGTLNPGSHYYWQIIAKDNHGATTSGPVWDFTTASAPVPPSVSTNDATNVQSTSATLNGNLIDMGGTSACYVWFQWGTTTGYGSETNHQTKASTGSFTADISGLSPGTTYHFRAVASNSAGTTYGNDKTFITPGDGDTLTIIHLTDTHIGSAGAADRFQDVLQYINNLNPKPDAVVISGDLVECGCLPVPISFSPFFVFIVPFSDIGGSSYVLLKSIIKDNLDANIQIYVSPGNHDYRLGRIIFNRIWTPYYWTFSPSFWPPGLFDFHFNYDLNNYNNLIAGNVDYYDQVDNTLICSLNSGHDTYDPSWDILSDIKNFIMNNGEVPTEGLYGTGLDDTQITNLNTWLGSTQAQNKIVFMHHPAVNYNDVMTISQNRNEFITCCENNDVDVVLTGHTHNPRVYDKNGNIYDLADDSQYLFCNKTYYVQSEDSGKVHASYRRIVINESGVFIYGISRPFALANLYVVGPAHIDAYDSNTHHVGLNKIGKPESNIHGGTYGVLETGEEFASLYYGKDDYRFVVKGTNDGVVNITLEIIMQNGTSSKLTFENVHMTKNSKATLYIYRDRIDPHLYLNNGSDGSGMNKESVKTIIKTLVPNFINNT